MRLGDSNTAPRENVGEICLSWAQWRTPLISALGKQKPDWAAKGVQDNQALLHREIVSWVKKKKDQFNLATYVKEA